MTANQCLIHQAAQEQLQRSEDIRAMCRRVWANDNESRLQSVLERVVLSDADRKILEGK